MDAETLRAIPPAGWVAVFFALAMAGGLLFLLLRLVAKKELRFKNVELVSPQEKKLLEAGAHDLLENQSANARNLLSLIWSDIYETGLRIFNITDVQEKWLLSDIVQLIDYELQHAVHLDLMRNHIQGKSEGDLMRYADAKAKGYHRLLKMRLLRYSVQLPKYHLSEILDHVTVDDFKKLFEEIYASSCHIAGGKR